MTVTIKHRKSSTPSAVPTTAQLALGELAINTFDGKLFLKKSVSGVETVVEVGAGGSRSRATVTPSTTDAQGQGPLTADINVLSGAAFGPGNSNAVTLPAATAGRWVTVFSNSFANTPLIKVYPASGDAFSNKSTNTPLIMVGNDPNAVFNGNIGGVLEFYCYVTGSWEVAFQISASYGRPVVPELYTTNTHVGGTLNVTGAVNLAALTTALEVDADWLYGTFLQHGFNNAVTAGTNAQGQGALTVAYNRITTTAANPSGCTLPTPYAGIDVVVVNGGTNPVKLYPASGHSIDGLAANTAIDLPVGAMVTLYASSGTTWLSDLKAPAAGNPAFGAWASAVTSLTSGVAVKVACATKEFDTHGYYDTTLSRYTPKVAGNYDFKAQIRMATAFAAIQVIIYKNGAFYKELGCAINSAPCNGGSCIVPMNGTTDYVEFFCNQSAATQNNINGQPYTWFSGALVG